MSKIDYNEIINRFGYFRNKANLSMRELSGRLGMNAQFVKTIESKQVELKVKTLLDFCEIVGIDIQDFFYLGKEFNSEDKNMLEMFKALSSDNKKIIIDLMKKL